jgi:hypothetical protein
MPVIGFDSFQGLPEDWRDGYPEGMFACEQPRVIGATIVAGMFEDTLPGIDPWLTDYNIGLLHIDCDLYTSTTTVLKHVAPHIKPGCYIVFDEWHSFDGCKDHEQRAWREFTESTDVTWEVIGHGLQQWAIKIVDEEPSGD